MRASSELESLTPDAAVPAVPTGGDFARADRPRMVPTDGRLER